MLRVLLTRALLLFSFSRLNKGMQQVEILLVEDDASLGFIIKDNLEMKGWRVDLFADGQSGWDAFKRKKYALCVLDVMLPKMDGFVLAENIRSLNSEVPILFLTARATKDDRIEGFKKGADDYITKPFSIEELQYRVTVFLKRSGTGVSSGTIVKLGAYDFDYANLTLAIASDKTELTQMEADLLKLFCDQKGKLIKREEILKAVWNSDDYFLGRSLDVFISKLRKYLKSDANIEIVNQFGVGFRLDIKGQ
jgi:DNA-binding response OmpR family regulator